MAHLLLIVPIQCWDLLSPSALSHTAKQCGGILTEPERQIRTPGYPEEYEDEQICYWHIRVRYGQRIRLHFLDFDLEDDTSCMADYLEVYDSYDDITGFAGRYVACRPEEAQSRLRNGTFSQRCSPRMNTGVMILTICCFDVPGRGRRLN